MQTLRTAVLVALCAVLAGCGTIGGGRDIRIRKTADGGYDVNISGVSNLTNGFKLTRGADGSLSVEFGSLTAGQAMFSADQLIGLAGTLARMPQLNPPATPAAQPNSGPSQ